MDHLEKNSLLSDDKHGFMPGRSCTTQLLESPSSSGRKPLTMEAAWTVPTWTSRRPSPWTDVLSGIPQGSVLGPLLFVLYINDMSDMVKSLIKLFANDTKVYSRTDDRDSCNALQKDVDALVDWSRTWQLPFNPDKCKVLRVQCRQEAGQEASQYWMNSDANTSMPLEQCNIEKDLGVHVDNQLNFSVHIREAINKSNRLLGTIRRAYQFLDSETMMFLYKGLVRPALEYGVVVWAPYLQKDIEALEAVQRRVIRMIPELRHLPYENRLRRLGLPTLVYRRHRGDIIHMYKYLHGLHKICTDMLPVCLQSATRGHSL